VKIGPASSRHVSHGSIQVQKNNPAATAEPAPINAPFSTESDRRTLTLVMSATRTLRMASPAVVVTTPFDTPTIRVRCSCPLESVSQIVAPGRNVLSRTC
jgi:hypothetical protein